MSRAAAGSPLDAFTGGITPTKTGLLYRVGLGVVAFAMVLLPLIYISLIALTVWIIFLHLKNDLWIFEGSSGRGGLYRLIAYLGPAIAGGILVFFMVKPFFAAKAKSVQRITLDPAREPLLFSFVKKICGLVGAPVPCRIDVDGEVNASASLRKGFLSRDLVLTIGLPLVSGLDMRQFAGVLAHEFGHFAQGAGMRLTYIIRKINFWFARVVYERDSWDLKLEQSARGSDWRIGIVLHAARGCVWLTRRILWALMQIGHAISCFMLRQMEYDADSYEAKIAGSDAFASTATRLRVLNVALQVAFEDVRQSWASNRLPENLPLLIEHKAGALPQEIHQKLSSSAASEKTGWFDTHPCDNDRVRAVQRLNQSGIFHLADPAQRLFADFSDVSKRVTRHQYQEQFELEFTEANLIGAEELLRESAASAEADAMVRKYYGNINIALKPLLTEADLPANAIADPAANWRAAQQSAEALRAEAETVSRECVEQQKRTVDLTVAQHLAKAGFQLDTAEFGLPPTATSVNEQEIAARFALDEAKAALSAGLAKLDPFMAALRQQVTPALAVAQTNASLAQPNPPEDVVGLVRLLSVVGAEMARAHEIGSRLRAFTVLAQNRGNHSKPEEVGLVLSQLSSELQRLNSEVRGRLEPFTYPFAHARGSLTVAAYLQSEKPAENELHRTYLESDAVVDRLFALNYRLLGRVLALANAQQS